jgi:hypothetical protein
MTATNDASSGNSIDEVHLRLYRALRDSIYKLEHKRDIRRARMYEIFATFPDGAERSAAVEALLREMMQDILAELEQAMPGPRTH